MMKILYFKPCIAPPTQRAGKLAERLLQTHLNWSLGFGLCVQEFGVVR